MIPVHKLPPAAAALPAGGTAGQLLGKTDDGVEWTTPQESGVGLVGVVRLSGQPSATYKLFGSNNSGGFDAPTHVWTYTTLRDVAFSRIRLTPAEMAGRTLTIKVNGTITASASLVADGSDAVADFASPQSLPADATLVIELDKTPQQPDAYIGLDSKLHRVSQPVLGGGALKFINNSVNLYAPCLTLLLPEALTKQVAGPLDFVDMPKTADAASVPNGGQALLTTSMPPRMVYRAADGTLYYGPLYSSSPEMPPGAEGYSRYRLNVTQNLGSAYMELAALSLLNAQSQDVATGGVASSTSQLDAQTGPERAFDNDPATWWTAPNVPASLTYTLPSAAAIVGYALTCKDGGGRSPYAWNLEGSNDGATWVALHAVAAAGGWTTGETKTYTI